jgi:pimeloyl-ACP methyl ester carboxylesterase
MEWKRLRLAPGEIPYLESGKGPNVLFLHGAVATSEAYTSLLSLLSGHFHIVAPVHPGHGKSFPIPRDWKLNNFITIYQEFLLELPFKPEIIIGHSFGGMVALLLSLSQTCRRIIAMDAPGLPFDFALTDYTKAMVNEARDVINKRSDKEQFKDTAKAAGTLFQTVFRHPFDMSRVAQHGPRYTIVRELRTIATPVTLLWGGNDNIVPVQFGKEMQTVIPGATLTVFPGRGHNYPVTDPEFTYNEIIKAINNKQ